MEFLQTIDYSQIVDIVAKCIATALPIGVVFGLGGKAVTFFMSMAFGREEIKL